jgi:hypothetical protein
MTQRPADAQRSTDPAWAFALDARHVTDLKTCEMTGWMPWLNSHWVACRRRVVTIGIRMSEVYLQSASDFASFLYASPIEEDNSSDVSHASDQDLDATVDLADVMEDAMKDDADSEVAMLPVPSPSIAADKESQQQDEASIWNQVSRLSQPQLLRALKLHQQWIPTAETLTDRHVRSHLNQE